MHDRQEEHQNLEKGAGYRNDQALVLESWSSGQGEARP